MTRARRVKAALGAALVAATVASGSAVGVDGPGSDAVTLAARLADTGDQARTTTTPVPAARARAVADERAVEVPLPQGGTFSGVRWEQVPGEVTPAEIAATLQYNAVCQWLRAWRDGRERAVAERVLALMPDWPAWRGGETADVLAQIAAEVRAGHGATLEGVLADCDASRAREVEYATTRGLPPTR